MNSHLHPFNAEGFARQARARSLESEIATLAAHIHAASYRLIELLAEFEAVDGWQGWPSPAHWLQWRCGFSLNAAREKFRVARALPALPRIREAFRKGELSFAQVRAMTRVAKPDNEATVLMWARHSTASQLVWERLQPRPAPTDLSEDEAPPACRGLSRSHLGAPCPPDYGTMVEILGPRPPRADDPMHD